MLPRLEAGGPRCGHDFFLAFSPEREDPGNRTHDPLSVSKLVGGIDPARTALATDLYGRAYKNVVPVSSAEVAESAKLLENIYRAVNIALVNEIKLILREMVSGR
jgi:UDP-N-acetyl-D-glucosamine dehydrogenase